MSGSFVDSPTVEWTVERFKSALSAKGVWTVNCGNNANAWFAGVKKAVDEGLCTFESFVHYMSPETTWKAALQTAKVDREAESQHPFALSD